MNLLSRLENVHLDHGNRTRHRVRVSVGLLAASILAHSAEAFGMPVGVAAIYVNLIVSFVWVWE